MNREIKFRAWDKEDSKMYKVVSISESIWGHEEEKHLLICDFDKNPMNQKTDVRISVNYELMEFTGLHDKNGVPIYEGDLVEYSCEGEQYVASEIIYCQNEAMFCFKDDSPNQLSLYSDFLVIDNVYEKHKKGW